MSSIKKVAIIGTGVIGAGWIIRCLAHNKIVYAFDKDLELKKNLLSEIKRTWPFVKKLFNKKKLNLNNFHFFTSIEQTLKDADFIQECATENYSLKTKLMSTIGKYAKSTSIIASSSSSVNWGFWPLVATLMTPPVAVILIRSEVSLYLWRTAFLAS